MLPTIHRLNCIVVLITCLLCSSAWSDEIIITYSSTSTDRHEFRDTYTAEVLRRCLEVTKDKFGPYQLRFSETPMAASRAAKELVRGNKFTLLASTYKPAIASQTKVVPFPINKGLANFRFFFARKESLDQLKEISSLEQLKAYSVGQGVDWSTARILTDNGFKVVYSGNSDVSISLPKMLSAGRFDLYMRGATEVVRELKAYSGKYPDLALVENIAIYTYLPTFFYVSRENPQLAERVYQGLVMLDSQGELENLLQKHYDEALKLIKESNLKLFKIANTNLESGMYQRDKPHLLDFGYSAE